MLGSLTIITLAVAVWSPYAYRCIKDIIPIVQHINLNKNHLSTLPPNAKAPIHQVTSKIKEKLPIGNIRKDLPDVTAKSEYTISSGDTLIGVLNQYGIDMENINALTNRDKMLRHLKVGQKLSWTIANDGTLQLLTWKMNQRETRTYQCSHNGSFTMQSSKIQKGEWQKRVIKGEVHGSFAASAQRAGIISSEISAVMKVLQWQMDFRKLKTGDNFSILISSKILNGKSTQSKILGVRLRSGGKDYYAFRTKDGKFYDRNGSGLAHGFMRFPTVKQYRVSSHFNPRRLNPITGRIAPHKGVDFALPVGTSVMTVSDGEVVAAKNGGASGNYIAIRHGQRYMTRYMHLKKVLVKPGQKVKHGDRIALSGNTGRSTGPHLHFEVWINNRAVNPLTAKLPRIEGLTGKARRNYLNQVKSYLPPLNFR